MKNNPDKIPVWCDSRVEEVVGTLWLIAAFVALDAGCPKWVFVTLFVKAGLDQLTAIGFAIKGCIEKAAKRQNVELSNSHGKRGKAQERK